MKTRLTVIGTALAIALSIGAGASDFSVLSNEQLLELRVDQMSETERQAFRAEVRSRVAGMDRVERQQFRDRMRLQFEHFGEYGSHGAQGDGGGRSGAGKGQGEGHRHQRGKGGGG